MDLGCNTASTRAPAAQDVQMNLRLQHSLGPWSTDNDTISRDCMDHRDFSRCPIRNELLYLRHPVIAQNQANCAAGQCFGGQSLCCCTPPCSSYSANTYSPVQPSLTLPCCISSSDSLYCVHSVLFLCLSHLSIAYLFIIVALEMAVYHTVYILFAQTALHANSFKVTLNVILSLFKK